jgi:hypothetical protein
VTHQGGMPRRIASGLVVALWILVAASAKAETQSAKESTVARLRSQLSHYDLGPDGTIRVLEELGRFSTEAENHASAAADEAAFLRAAVGSDLLFLAGFSGDQALATRIAESFGVAPDALKDRLASELRSAAHGVYKGAAEAALADLLNPGEAAPKSLRADAVLVQRARQLATGAAPGGGFATLGTDPCDAADRCIEPYLSLTEPGRRAYFYMDQIGAALQRLAASAQPGDPLAQALAEPIGQARTRLSSLRLRLPSRLPSSAPPLMADGNRGWFAPDVVFMIEPNGLRYQFEPLAGITTGGAQLADPTPAVSLTGPGGEQGGSISGVTISAAAQELQGRRGLSAGVAAARGTPAQLVGRVLAALSGSGFGEPWWVGRSVDGNLVGVVLHVTNASAPSSNALTLRVHSAGYTLHSGAKTLEIPRIKVNGTYQFDLDRLRNALSKHQAGTARVSFADDVAAEQVLMALVRVANEAQPVELVVP